MTTPRSHGKQNGSDRGALVVVIPVAMRGREDGAELEFGNDGDPAFALRASSGGSSKPLVCVTGERTHALTSEGADASEDGTGRGTPVVYQCHGSNVGPMGTLRQGNGGVTGGVPFMADAGVRRLSPMECERLQGYDDQWTEWGLKEDGDKTAQSDAQRYRQLGNSVAVPVVSWIAERLTEVDGRM